MQQVAEARRLVDAAHQVVIGQFKGGAQAAGFAGQFQSEQGFDDNAEGKLPHFPGHIDALSVLPAPVVAGGVLGHHRAIAVHAAVVKLGLHQPALAQVVGALGGDQAFAHHPFEDFGVGAASQALVVGDHQVAHQVGMVDLIQQRGLDRQRSHIAVSGGGLHKADGVAQIAQGLPDDGQLRRARGQGTAVHRRAGRVGCGAGSSHKRFRRREQ